MEPLARCAVAVLGSQRFLATKLILNLPAVATAFPLHVEALVVIMDFVWLSMLPLVFFAVGSVSSLKLVAIVSDHSIGISTTGVVGLILLLGRHVAEWAKETV